MSEQLTQKNALLKGAGITAVANAIINGAIHWFTSDHSKPAYLTQDAISSSETTVFGSAVVLAVSLAFILSSIAYATLKLPGKPPYFPKIFIMAIKHALYAFGLVVVVGLLVQRFAGSIEVSHAVAALLSGIIAGITGGLVDYEVKRTLAEGLA
jgi:hypothetical protein